MTEDPPVSTDRLPEDSPLKDDPAFAAECKAIGEDLQNIRVTPLGNNTFVCVSARDGNLDEYHVDLSEPTCTCDDYRLSEADSSTCAHVVLCVLTKGHNPDPEQFAQHDLTLMADRANSILHDLREAVQYTTTQMTTEAMSESTDELAKGNEVDGPDGETVIPKRTKEKAAELKAAYDEHIQDMKVEASGDWIYIDMGYDTEEKWPGTGGVVKTFDVVTADPMEYVYGGPDSEADSDHPAYDGKPTEYHDNAIKPEDVDEYIAEVL